MDDRHIFLEALNRPAHEARSAYLDEACGDDADLRKRVELLLAAHEDAGSFLEKTPEELLATIGQEHETDLDSWKELLTPSDQDECLGMLGRYEVLELIGRGGMGVVLSARDPQLNRVVAIKMLAPELSTQPVSVRRFLREAKSAAAVSHDHVITIHAVDEQAKPPLIVMERIAGQSLQEKIDREGPLDVKSILRIGMQTAAGLAAAHKQGLIHRDIKPSNILLENGIERVKLTDFGLARAVDDVGMTRTGQITGTPQYMSPEQAQGHPIDHRTDLFSLGCVLYAMCTGRAAFRAESAVAVMHRVVHENPKPIREINEDIPDWLCRIIDKLMEKNPDLRFASASEVEDLLGRHLAHLQQPDSVPQPQITTQSIVRQAGQLEEALVSASRTFLGIGLASLASFVWVFLALSNNWFRDWNETLAVLILIGGLISLPVGLLAMNAHFEVRRKSRYWWVNFAARTAIIPWNPFLLLVLPWTLRICHLLDQPQMKHAFGLHTGKSERTGDENLNSQVRSRMILTCLVALILGYLLTELTGITHGVIRAIDNLNGKGRIELTGIAGNVKVRGPDARQNTQILREGLGSPDRLETFSVALNPSRYEVQFYSDEHTIVSLREILIERGHVVSVYTPKDIVKIELAQVGPARTSYALKFDIRELDPLLVAIVLLGAFALVWSIREWHRGKPVDSPQRFWKTRPVLTAALLFIGVFVVLEQFSVTTITTSIRQAIRGKGTLNIESDTSDVSVSVSGNRVSMAGTLPFQMNLPAGRYQVVASKPLGNGQFAHFNSSFEIKAGRVASLYAPLAKYAVDDWKSIERFLDDTPRAALLHVTVEDPDVHLTINGVDWDIAGKGEQVVPLKPGRYDILGLKGSVKAFHQAVELKAGDDRSLEFKSLEVADTEAAPGTGTQDASTGTADDNEQNSPVELYSRRPRRKETTPVLAVDVTTDGKWIASGHRGAGDLRLWDVSQQDDNSYVFRAKYGNCSILDVEFSPDDRYVAWVQSNGQLRLRNASSHQITTIDKFERVEDMFRAVAWSSDGKTILVGGQGKLYLWHIENLENPILLTVDVPEKATVLDIEWSPRKREFATALYDGRILIWNAEDVTPTVKTTLHAKGGQPAHEGQAHAVSYSPAGDLLVSCGEDGYVRAWSPERSGEFIWERDCSHGQPLLDVQIAPDGRLCATGGTDRKLHLFELRTRESVIKGRIDGTGRTDHVVSNSEITSVCFFHKGPFLLTASADGVIMWWRYPRSTSTVDTPEIADWKLRLSEAAALPLDEWNTLAGDVKGPHADAVRGEPLSLVLFKLNPFDTAKENEKVRQDFWYLTETIPKPNEIGKAIGISREKGFVSFLQPEYINTLHVDQSDDNAQGHAGFTVPKLYSGRVEFQASRQDGKWQITEFTLPNYGIILRPDEQGLWQREISTIPLNLTIDEDGNVSIQSDRVEWADLDQTLRNRRKSMGEQPVIVKFHPDTAIEKVNEVVDLLKKHEYGSVRISTLSRNR